ncbi:[citrate (pro-3S)-lyase] ligase [Brenneria corticis]|uniref:[Citrate [pro-3S]-lyase] ligase n=1 Tax=Brenneria corticis TaxID=2173106 RepID=A0A2U1U6L5_9GAMM|nr:[citrate (pro-3S)-lyase] ligase [Brenneria sp. CFCC 11842]PWC17289.1 [citrate (pro-3S)-lyase] ligase [Brenneria sp. CFCC 11842]
MHANDSIFFDTLDMRMQPQAIPEIRRFLALCRLGMDDDIDTFVTCRLGGELVACAGMAANTIKCVAVAPQHRDRNLGVRVINEVVQQAAQRGHFHLFLYTKPQNIAIFRACGFYPLAQYQDSAVLMENTPIGITQYCRSLAAYRRPGTPIGAVVMNANPFTLGHRYLAERAAQSCDWLHLFVVREDASLFPFDERLEMVRRGVAHINNLTVHAGSEYMISKATFPGYFLKEEKLITRAHAALDLIIFRKYIAPALGVTRRFVGTEPFCALTRQYNQDMGFWQENASAVDAPALAVIEIERKRESSGVAISASEVRKLLKLRQYRRIQELVPASTLEHLQRYYQAEYA